MTQYIAPNMAMAMQYSNQQGMDPSNRYGSGILSLADGGFIGGGLGDNWYIWAIVAINVILILAIIIVAIRLMK